MSFCNTYKGVGMALKHAKTVEAAREAIEPYTNRLRATEEGSGAEGRRQAPPGKLTVKETRRIQKRRCLLWVKSRHHNVDRQRPLRAKTGPNLIPLSA
jgi:hypothetical protein